jgi:class 3 adenylate cyclase/tetratricopeptide (TPR) repeat protein
MESPIVYIPMDRRQAIAQGQGLPDRACGAVLFADVAGFTPLTEALARQLGPRRGAEELVDTLNLVYGALVAEVHRHRGSVISFSGDAITCWFAADEGRQATACALAMQRALGQLAELQTSSGVAVTVAIKVGVAAGAVRRFLVGDPQIQLIDVLAGATVERMAMAEKHAERGEVVVAPEVAAHLGDELVVSAWREAAEAAPSGTSGPLAVVARLARPVEATPGALAPRAQEEAAALLDEEQVQAWLLPPVYERLRAGQGRFLAELRPAVPLFARFAGLDYDGDDAAGAKLDGYVRWVQGVLARYESFLLQLTCGDKGSYLYAAFGAPLAHDDDPARAVAAALELRTPPQELDSITAVHIGISAGRMWVGAYGGPTRRTYGVIGDEVNVAARLMAAAAAGEILVSERVATAASRGHSFEYLRRVELKGKQEPLPVYGPTARPRPSPQRPATLYTGPLVGRADELGALEQSLSPVLAGQGGVLCLQGEAGIGKSRLAAEFVERAIGRGLRAVLGTCHSTSQGIAYTPWRQIFRVLLGLAEGPAAAAGEIAQVEAAVRQANGQWLLRLPLLGDLVDLPIPDNETTAAFSPQLRQESLFALAVGMVQTWSTVQPLLLLVEDAHWMDEASLGLTLALGRALGRAPVLLVLVHRPVLLQERPLWPGLERLPQHQRIVLEELPPEGIQALVAIRLGGNPAPLTLALVAVLAQGNPFFTEELVDALREGGGLLPGADGSWVLSEPLSRVLREANCLAQEGGQWVLAPEARLSAADLGLPDSLYGIVLSRMDRLPEPPKLTLKVASVIGRSFEFDLLGEAHPAAPGQGLLLEQMQALEARDFTRLEIPLPQRAYLFKHSITHEVVYGTLLEHQQRELHRAVGESLEQLLPEAVGRLAYHYSRSGVRDKAIHYLRRAGEQAAARYANAEAVSYFSRVLVLLPEDALAERYDLLLAREKVLDLQGAREAQRQDLAALQSLAGALRDDRRRVEVTLRRASYAHLTSDYPETVALAEEAVRLARALADASSEATALLQLGQTFWVMGNNLRARAELQQGLALARGAGLRAEEANCLLNLGNVALLSDPREAEQHYRQALALFREVGDRRGEGRALNNLGIARGMQMDPGGAQRHYEQALALSRQIGDRRGEGLALMNLGLTVQGYGSFMEARARCAEALQVSEEIGDRYNQSGLLGNLGDVLRDLGAYEEAWSYYRRALDISREVGYPENRILYELALLCHQVGDDKAACEHARQSAQLAEQMNDTDGQAHAWTTLGNALAGLGDFGPAAEAYRQAMELRRQMAYLTLQPQAGLASALLAVGDVAQARDLVDEILPTLEENTVQGLAEPLRVYLTCYQVLRASDDPRASAVLAAGYRILQERAARITDEALRRSYLENVAVHREIAQEMAQQLGRLA